MLEEDLPIFVPENYLTHKEIISRHPEHGWGKVFKQGEFRTALQNGRIHPSVILGGMVPLAQYESDKSIFDTREKE